MSKLFAEYLYTNTTEAKYKDWYIYNASSFADEVKHIIVTELSEIEKRIILLYAEYGNMRKVSETLSISLGKTYYVLHTIQNKIKTKLKKC